MGINGSSSFDLFIGGDHIRAREDERLETRDPANRTVLAKVARGKSADINTAVDAASTAFEDWSGLPPRERGRILSDVAEGIRSESEHLAVLETKDNGQPLPEARSAVEACATYFDYYAEAADKVHGDKIPLDDSHVDFTINEPLGVVGQIVPWNLPLLVFGRTVAPALATGNVSVVKPAEQTPLTALEVARIASDAGLPDGVLNVVSGYGSEAGAALSSHSDVDGVSFTGSVPTGIEVAKSALENVTNVHLELGGKSPNVVFPDADIEAAVQSTIYGIFSNAGQVCSAGSRLLLHESIHEEFLEQLIAKTEEIDIGPGMDDPDMGPLVSESHLKKVTEYIEIGRKEVGEPVYGGDVLDREGNFVEPTIFDDVKNSMRIAQEEIFGPVLSVIEFSSETEAIEIANDTEYGLVAGIHTTDLGRAHRFAKAVQAGQIYINEWYAGGVQSPFGGFKQSGFGREKGLAAIDSFTQVKNVCANIDV